MVDKKLESMIETRLEDTSAFRMSFVKLVYCKTAPYCLGINGSKSHLDCIAADD